jgi:uncharacterized protein
LLRYNTDKRLASAPAPRRLRVALPPPARGEGRGGATIHGDPMSQLDPIPYPDAQLRAILERVRTIAMVGASSNWNRPSYFVMKYLQGKGYRVIPVNPGLAGQELLGEKVYASLRDIPVDAVGPVDMVDVFRSSKEAPKIVEDAIAIGAPVVWMQLGIRNDEAARLAEANGFKVVMDRCPKIEYGRLSSEIGWMGVNTRVLTAKRAKLSGRGIQRMSLDRVTMAGGANSAATKASHEDDGGR